MFLNLQFQLNLFLLQSLPIFLFQFNEAHRSCAAQSDEQGLPDFGFALHDLFDFDLKDPVVRFSHEGDAVELGFVFDVLGMED